MNEKIKLVIVCIIVFAFSAGVGFLFGRASNQKRIDDALRIAEQERDIAKQFAIDLSGTRKYNIELEKYIAEIESDNRQNIENAQELERQNKKLRSELDYNAELNRLTRESLERLQKAIYGN